MATLVSPGVSVTVTDESFFIPAGSSTVPLFFIATADEKVQQDGVTPAAGTYESGVVRTVTSQKTALELYGVPNFLTDSSGNRHDGDARNEYGLAALQQYLNQGSLAYVVRANVNLDDNIDNIRSLWDKKITESAFALENLVNTYINEQNLTNQLFPGDPWTNAYVTLSYSATLTNSTVLNAFNGDTAVVTVDGTPITLTLGQPTGSPLPGSPNQAGSPGGDAHSVESLLNDLNTQLGSAATASLVAGAIKIQSSAVNGGGTDLGSSTSVVMTTSGFFATLITGSPVGYTITTTAGVDGYKETVDASEYLSLLNTAMTEVVYPLYSFANVEATFEDDSSSTGGYDVFPNGFDQPAVPPPYVGIAGRAGDGTGSNDAGPNLAGPGSDGTFPGAGSNPAFPEEWTAADASDDLIAAADDYKYTQEFFNLTGLGANDAARRTAIVTALNAEIVGNSDIRSENFEYNIIVCPGYWETNNEMVDLAASTAVKQEAVVIGDVPSNLTPSEAVAWAQTTERATSNLISYYYPWQLATNVDGNTICVAPSGTALKTWAYSDSVSEVWFAPAGTRRGLVTGVDQLGYVSGTLGLPTTFVPTYVDQGQRDDLYRYFVNVNPIVFFPGRGILVWGQKTSAPDASALDRINVTRLMAYVRRQIRKNTLSFVFQPNDQLTRDNLKAVVDSFLSDIVVKRGLYDFATICDETNNTPDRIDRNEMYIDIALKPVRAAEFIYVPIRIVATGADIG